jgi:hypothetical protein
LRSMQPSFDFVLSNIWALCSQTARQVAPHNKTDKSPRLWPMRHAIGSDGEIDFCPLVTSKGAGRMIRDSLYFLFPLVSAAPVLGWLLFVMLAA